MMVMMEWYMMVIKRNLTSKADSTFNIFDVV